MNAIWIVIIIIIIFIILAISYRALIKIQNSLLFLPTILQREDYTDQSKKELEDKYNIKISDGTINSTNKCKIHYMYLKKNSPKLFIFAHGNGGNLNRIETSNILLLLNYGSVLLFDYRGYGISTGEPTEKGLRDDTLCVWSYATKELGYSAKDIILYGESLGCSIVSWLVYYLLKNNLEPPFGIIMQSGFYSLKDIVSDIFGSFISYLVLYEFDNIKYLKYIKKVRPNYPILLLHSKTDNIINYSHSYRLATETNSQLYEIQGNHINPVFDDKVKRLINNFANPIFDESHAWHSK